MTDIPPPQPGPPPGPQQYPPPGPYPPQPPAKKGGAGKVVLGLFACGALFVLALVALAVLAAVGSNNTAQPTKVGETPTTTGPGGASPTPPAAGGFKTGDEVKVGKWTVTVNNVTDPYTTEMFTPPPGTRVVLVDATVKNLGDRAATVSSIMCFQLRGPDGSQYPVSMIVNAPTKQLDGQVDAGGQLRGVLGWQVPDGVTNGLQVRFSCDVLGGGSATINVT